MPHAFQLLPIIRIIKLNVHTWAYMGIYCNTRGYMQMNGQEGNACETCVSRETLRSNNDLLQFRKHSQRKRRKRQ